MLKSYKEGKPMTSTACLKRLGYAKYIYSQGVEHITHHTQLSNALAILSFQDATEILMLIIADELSYKPGDFMSNWSEVEKKGKKLPLKNQMDRLNRLRVSFKHHAVLPNRDDVLDCQNNVRDFMVSATQSVLGLDFNSITLADLVENPTIRESLAEAEKALDLGQYEESMRLSAIAFAFIKREALGDHWHQFIMAGGSFELKDIDPKILHISGSDAIERNFIGIKKGLARSKRCFEDIIERLNPLLMGIDNFKFTRFRLLTPQTVIAMDGRTPHQNLGWNPYLNKYNMNKENATFCFNFVIDTALKGQERALGLINAQAPDAVIVITDQASIYSLKERELEEIGRISKGSVFHVLDKVMSRVHNLIPYWTIEYSGGRALIKADDTEPVLTRKLP